MVDKVRALKIERSTSGGTQNDKRPTETDPSEDYLATKGVAFENSDDYLAEKIGGVLKFKIPDSSEKAIYTNDELTAYEIYETATQTTINRRVRGDFTYTGDNLTQEVWKIYDVTDGTTTLRTITIDHTYTGNDLTNTTVSEV